ncbi:SPFH domain-containing protein [Tenacibaculum sp. 190524A02b]|uniref:SPFH domain-containing protein n=1 Tax=Tenacibaculum vairaonense TaxID=3137860 RepID=UPI0031FB630D
MNLTLLILNQINLFNIIFIVIGIFILFTVLFIITIVLFHKKVKQGQVLIRSGFGGTAIAFDRGIYVIPFLHQLEIMDITLKKIELDFLASEAIICKNNLKANIKTAFFVKVNASKDDILSVAKIIGCKNASDAKALNNMFKTKFQEAIKTSAKKFTIEEIDNSTNGFRDTIIAELGRDHYGFSIEDLTVSFLNKVG